MTHDRKQHTALVGIDHVVDVSYWWCTCGAKRGGYGDNRECRDDALDHQETGAHGNPLGCRA